MAKEFSICVGTVGTGAWHSPDGGETWKRVTTGLWGESRVFGLPSTPKIHGSSMPARMTASTEAPIGGRISSDSTH